MVSVVPEHTIEQRTCYILKDVLLIRIKCGYAIGNQAVLYQAILHLQRRHWTSKHKVGILLYTSSAYHHVTDSHFYFSLIILSYLGFVLLCVSLPCIPRSICLDCYFATSAAGAGGMDMDAQHQPPNCLHLGNRPKFVHSETVPDVQALLEHDAHHHPHHSNSNLRQENANLQITPHFQKQGSQGHQGEFSERKE